MAEEHPGYRVYFLGAGFSRLAGLPLASELYGLVKQRIESRYGTDTKFHRDLERYLEYREACGKAIPDEAQIDMEEFMSYLDMEHYLGLRGSKTWSKEGNESQIMIRQAIGEVIHENTPPANALPQPYYDFAASLSVNDIVITLNYDILLERALDHIGRPYRLFPDRYKQIHDGFNTVDTSVDEIIVLKLHGSVDWFDDSGFIEEQAYWRERGAGYVGPKHSVFSDPAKFGAAPIVDGPRAADDPLLHIHRIRDADSYYGSERDFHAPLILSPSHVKFIYATPLLDFWHGMGRAGGLNLGVSVIGFSLPAHDEYIRMVLYQIISNYQYVSWDTELLGQLKDYVRLIDYREDAAGITEYKDRYSFVNQDEARYLFSGFDGKAIDFLFNDGRKP